MDINNINTMLEGFGSAIYTATTTEITKVYQRVLFQLPTFQRLTSDLGFNKCKIIPFDGIHKPNETKNHLITTMDIIDAAAGTPYTYRVGIFITTPKGIVAILFPVINGDPRSVVAFTNGSIPEDEIADVLKQILNWFIKNEMSIQDFRKQMCPRR